MTWELAMLQRMEKPPTLHQYLGEKPKAAAPEMLGLTLLNASRGLKTVSMREWRKSLH